MSYRIIECPAYLQWWHKKKGLILYICLLFKTRNLPELIQSHKCGVTAFKFFSKNGSIENNCPHLAMAIIYSKLIVAK